MCCHPALRQRAGTRAWESSPGVRCGATHCAECFTPRVLGRVACVHPPSQASHLPAAVRSPILQGKKLRLGEFGGILEATQQGHGSAEFQTQGSQTPVFLLRSAPQLPSLLIRRPWAGLLSEAVSICVQNDVAQRHT